MKAHETFTAYAARFNNNGTFLAKVAMRGRINQHWRPHRRAVRHLASALAISLAGVLAIKGYSAATDVLAGILAALFGFVTVWPGLEPRSGCGCDGLSADGWPTPSGPAKQAKTVER